VVLPLSILCEESFLFISWCAGDRCGMMGSDENNGRSRRPSVEDRGWSSTGRVLGCRTIERSSDVVCDLYHAQGDKEREFLGLASKPRSTDSSGLASKPMALGFPVWASKPVATVYVIWASKSLWQFLGLGLKTKRATIYQL
jgi:hypothetical protein